jgi:hypothetical protein
MGIASELSEENLELARKRAYLELKNHKYEEEIVKRISLFLEAIKTTMYPLEDWL